MSSNEPVSYYMRALRWSYYGNVLVAVSCVVAGLCGNWFQAIGAPMFAVAAIFGRKSIKLAERKDRDD